VRGVGATTALEQTNDGYRDLQSGKNIRGAIVHDT
jgi:Zn-dependent alcohol dehydrogenase